MAKTAAEQTAAWKAGMAKGGAKWSQGVQQTTKNPMALAAAQADKMLANVSNAVTSGMWAQKLNATPVSFWRQQCQNAQASFAQGGNKGETKYNAFATQAQATIYPAMRQAVAAAGSDPVAKVGAALQVLMASGKKGKAAGM